MEKTTQVKLETDMKNFIRDCATNKDKMHNLIDHYKINNLYHYSFLNCIMIYIQGGTIAQSFNNWKKLNRHVKKGEKSHIYIYVPLIKKETEKKPTAFITESGVDFEILETKRLIGFAMKPIFDISQTDGQQLEYAHNSKDDTEYDYTAIRDKLSAVVKREIKEDITGDARGYCNEKQIVISSMSNNADRIKTLVHESAHVLLGHTDKDNKTIRQVVEIEAETVTNFVLTYMNMNTELSESYVSNWLTYTPDSNDADSENTMGINYKKMIAVTDKIIKSIQ